MALSEGNVILASDFIALKARVKAECKRRKYNGSVEAYAGSSYDYTVKPKNGNVPLPEHFNKIIVPMNAMVKTGRSKTKNGDLVRAMNDIVQIFLYWSLPRNLLYWMFWLFWHLYWRLR